jgi:hypothetical protein
LISRRRVEVPLAVAGIGAIVVLLPFLGTIPQICGVVAIVLGTVMTAPPPSERGAPEFAGVHWWSLLAAGAVCAVLSVPVELLLDTIGGLLAGIGGALALIGVVFGFPR